MRASINRDGCISCGQCVEICPQVFRMAADSLAQVYQDPVPQEAEAAAVSAQESCPVAVITVH